MGWPVGVWIRVDDFRDKLLPHFNRRIPREIQAIPMGISLLLSVCGEFVLVWWVGRLDRLPLPHFFKPVYKTLRAILTFVYASASFVPPSVWVWKIFSRRNLKSTQTPYPSWSIMQTVVVVHSSKGEWCQSAMIMDGECREIHGCKRAAKLLRITPCGEWPQSQNNPAVFIQ